MKIVDGIKLDNQLILKWGRYPELFGGPSIITSILVTERNRIISVRVMWGKTRLKTKGDHEPKNAGKEIDSDRNFLKYCSPTSTLSLVH